MSEENKRKSREEQLEKELLMKKMTIHCAFKEVKKSSRKWSTFCFFNQQKLVSVTRTELI